MFRLLRVSNKHQTFPGDLTSGNESPVAWRHLRKTAKQPHLCVWLEQAAADDDDEKLTWWGGTEETDGLWWWQQVLPLVGRRSRRGCIFKSPQRRHRCVRAGVTDAFVLGLFIAAALHVWFMWSDRDTRVSTDSECPNSSGEKGWK